MQHCRDFKEFHRNNLGKMSRLGKAVLSHHTTMEREQRKKQELLEKERIRRLMVCTRGREYLHIRRVSYGGAVIIHLL